MKVLAETTATVLAETTAQVLVADTVTLPVAAVKVSEIVASVRDMNCFVINNKVIFQGTLHKQIFFVDLKGLVRHVGVDIPFSGFVDLPGVQAGAACELFPSVEFLNFSFIAPNLIRENVVIAVVVKVINLPTGGQLFTNTIPPTLLRFEEPNTFRASGNPPGSVVCTGNDVSAGNVISTGNAVCSGNAVSGNNISQVTSHPKGNGSTAGTNSPRST